MTMNTSMTYSDAGLPAMQLDTDDRYPLNFDALAAAADPANWPLCLANFTAMIDNGVNAHGWTRMIEHVRYGLIGLRTPLRFWKDIGDDFYRIEYALDTDPVEPGRVDGRVMVDEGFIDVRRRDDGVAVCTRKVFAVSGASPLLSNPIFAAWAGAVAAPLLGWHAYSRAFFVNQAAIAHPYPFARSEGTKR